MLVFKLDSRMLFTYRLTARSPDHHFENFSENCIDQINSPDEKPLSVQPSLVALVESAGSFGWNRLDSLLPDPVVTGVHISHDSDIRTKESYALNDGITGVVVPKEMIRNVSGQEYLIDSSYGHEY